MNEKIKRGREFLFSNVFFGERTRLATFGTMITNLLAGVVEIVISILIASFYFGIIGVYNLVFGFVKIFALKKYNDKKIIEPMATWTSITSFLFLAFAIAVTFWIEENAEYNTISAITIALIAFIKLGFGIGGAVKSRRFSSPVLTQIKLMNIADGFVALALTQRAILFMKETPNANFYSGIGGIVLGTLALGVALFMHLYAYKRKSL